MKKHVLAVTLAAALVLGGQALHLSRPQKRRRKRLQKPRPQRLRRRQRKRKRPGRRRRKFCLMMR